MKQMTIEQAIKVLSNEANHLEGAIDEPVNQAEYLSDFFKSSYAAEFLTAINVALKSLKGATEKDEGKAAA